MFTYNCNGIPLDFSVPKVMGIINITPDSFFAESRVQNLSDISQKVEIMLSQGAHIIDLGAVSSRPGATILSEKEESNRLIPVFKSLRKDFPSAIFSIDTFRSTIAQEVLDFGANIINDISAGNMDPDMFNTINKYNAPYIMMHMIGDAQSMQDHTDYDNIIIQMLKYFTEKVSKLNSMGQNDIIIDPGFGFSKKLMDNYKLMNSLNVFKIYDLPILVGISRKSMIYKLLEIAPEESLSATSALHLQALINGSNILRVHDVKEAVQIVKLYHSLKGT